jgi:solute carrier family 8 (sodium/calcium exchanger)
VGSAAFNLLIIIGICVMVIPPANIDTGEPGFRKIDDLNVFSLTATFSMFAYIWLYLMLDVISPNVVTLPEAAATFLMCPLLVWLAWLADTGFFSRKKETSDEETNSKDAMKGTLKATNAHGMLRDLNVKAKGANAEDLSNVILAHKFENTPISRAKYRIQALRSVTGKKLALPQITDSMKASLKKVDSASQNSSKEVPSSISFESTAINTLESCGTLSVAVKLNGPAPTSPITVDFYTEGKTATMGEDFLEAKGTLTFDAENTTRNIDITIIKDDELEEDEFFLLHLTNQQPSTVLLVDPTATVRIIDDDMPGTVAFEPTFSKDGLNKPASPTGKGTKSAKVVPEEKVGHFCEYFVQESAGKVDVRVVRTGGTAGRAVVKYYTRDVTAMGGMDYEGVEDGELVFEQGEAVKSITINIMDDECFEKDESFELRLREASGAELGGLVVATIIIKNDDEMKELGDKVAALLQLNKDKYSVGTSSYKQQFAEAVEWPEDGGCLDIVSHLLSLPWKVIFATCPPPLVCGGWPCFFVSLGYIGLVTAFIGDLAGLLGCTIGMKGSITAITFVAMGTSLPDTFASKTAAIGDKNADNSVGNVTGSNSVNVFLGLGLPWLMAAVYWELTAVSPQWAARVSAEVRAEYPNGAFYVPSGDLGFSVVIFTACAAICIGSLFFRRWKYGYELGGDAAKPFGFFFFFLWFLYIAMSVLSAYSYI